VGDRHLKFHEFRDNLPVAAFRLAYLMLARVLSWLALLAY
jgi:hypothetical protein